MYAERYGPQGLDRRSLSLSVGIVGGLLAAGFLASPVVKHFIPEPVLHIYPVDPETPPPPPDPVAPKVRPKTVPQQRMDTPKVLVPTNDPPVLELPPAPPVPLPPPSAGLGEGTGGGTVQLAKPVPPVLTPAGVDERYANAFQPPYPAAEQRAGNEGLVTVRVLIGVDGRVQQIEQLAAASDAFWRVTKAQALGRWRFRPATRDGVPVEQWKTMTVRFQLRE